ncbi:MAG TPA: hydroxyacylglutathione hydrolase [Rhodobacteraceae bacterium]|jgi:hydroxyacylglutathione hydrolase|nr:hydroxyacylglutathione hydrolase [Paracoccaceae bacterium]
MPLQIVTVACLSDNYAFLLHDPDSGQTALVDAPEAAPIIAELKLRGWNLTQILITHHHYDHIDGVEELRSAYGAKVIGAKADAHRLPRLDTELIEGDTVSIGGNHGVVIDVSGHTIGHIAFHFPRNAALFTADSLMALGCGRLFEGTPAQMWQSLSKLINLPDITMVYSGHEYTQSNASFAYSIEPNNPALKNRILQIIKARSQNMPTVPSLLADEQATNPFLRPDSAEIRTNLGMESASNTAVFTEIRRRKDNFSSTKMPNISQDTCDCD